MHKNKIAVFFSILFLAFIIVPTVITLVDSSVDISYVYSNSEEESSRNQLEKAKIIKGYTAIIDHEKIGYSLTAIIEIIAKNDIVDIEEEISKFENVCGVYDITGSTDTIIVSKFKERNELSKFVKGLGAIPNVENTITHVVLNTAKEDFRLS